MKQFWDLFSRSIIITGMISVMVVGGAVYMAIAQIPLPDWYTITLSIVVGFFYGQKAGVTTSVQAKG
jgi:hypothetical protein